MEINIQSVKYKKSNMNKRIASAVLLGMLTIANMAYALNPNSAYREPGQDWKRIATKALLKNAGQGGSIYETAIQWDATTLDKQQRLLSQIPVWPDYQTISSQFIYLRDHRYLTDPIEPQNNRTIPWRYPVDWCFERAAAAVSLYNNNLLPRPAKVFAFGNLQLLSPFGQGANGLLSFWYHVAPVIRDQQTNHVYVLDPALNYEAPLPLESWLKQLVELSEERGLVVNMCNGYGSIPFDVCSQATPASEKAQADDVVNRLPSEWDHLQSKGINSDKVLGSDMNPPASFSGKMIYGSIGFIGGLSGFGIKDKLVIQYKPTDETNWNNVLDIGQLTQKISQYEYFFSRTRIPVGSIFGNAGRSSHCQCTFYSCACDIPESVNKIDMRVVLNDKVIKQCTYQYPLDAGFINKKYYGPDINYSFRVNQSGEIDVQNITGSIDGCKET